MDELSQLPEDLNAYDAYAERMRKEEFPMLRDAIYLDHAGATLYSKSLFDRFHADMMANLYGNPHSASPSSQRSTLEIENVRLQLLRFFKADPEHFDLVFTANATASIKLVGEALRELDGGFCYGYHMDSHTSMVGLRELARHHRCLEGTEDLRSWIPERAESQIMLIGFPLQSNMNGHRLPATWAQDVIQSCSIPSAFTLADAAAFASTSPVDLSNPATAPDFTVMSLNKIFGSPDLGCLIVKKSAASIFRRRRYFGGGTVDIVVCRKEQWHAKKTAAVHEQLEDGTLPIHSILVVKSAVETHQKLFGTLERVSQHTTRLATMLFERLSALQHWNGEQVCTIHRDPHSQYGESKTQGPIVAFNLRDHGGNWVSNAEVEKLAAIRNIHIRTGGVCNPGGVASALKLSPWEMRENFSAGHRCGGENDILNGKPTGIIRASFGAMSTRSDVERFLGFIEEFWVNKVAEISEPSIVGLDSPSFHVESLTIYPIKSCAGWQIPHGKAWEVRQEGLAWDREWCIVHSGTGKAISQKQHPLMALLRPRLDLIEGLLIITSAARGDSISVSLSKNPSLFEDSTRLSDASVCNDTVQALVYNSPTVSDLFTEALNVPCTLARYNPASAVSRHSNAHLQIDPLRGKVARPLQLSNESPILTISRSSLNRLNECIKAKGGKAAAPSVFRPNIVLAESVLLAPGQERPWAEDTWQSMRIGGAQGAFFDFLGGCRRCQMVCVDQDTAQKNAEPFVTLAKTRRHEGRVLFGVHTALCDRAGQSRTISIGDQVETFCYMQETDP